MATSKQSSGTNGSQRGPITNLLELPNEIISLIVQNVPYRDIPKLCCVSKAFRERAAAELYRIFEHTFGPSQSRSQGLPKDILAGSLETLATSDYNYASHIREILIDTTNTGESGERSCREFSYEHSCGKFLQTLLLTVLKRTQGIERFYWNTRIELSSAVYRTLHAMPQLRHVHVRLQVGPSLHSTSNTTTEAAISSAPAPTIVPAPHPGYGAPPGYIPSGQPSSYNHHAHQGGGSSIHLVKKAPVTRRILRPVTFSKFEKLTSLSVLDMDTLESVPEIAECINKSSATLKMLCLSLSDKFARKARRVNVSGSVSENTVTEDDASDVSAAPPPPLNVDGTENTSGLQLPDTPRSYLQAQDNALAQILAFSQSSPPSKELKVAAKEFIAQAQQEEADREAGIALEIALRPENDNVVFDSTLEALFQKRPTNDGGEDVSNNDWYKQLEGLAEKYLESRKNTWRHKKAKRRLKVVPRRQKAKLAPPPQLQPSSGPVGPGTLYSPSHNHHHHHPSQPMVQSFVPLAHSSVHLPDASSNASSHSSASSGWGVPVQTSQYNFAPKSTNLNGHNYTFVPMSGHANLPTLQHAQQLANHAKSNAGHVWMPSQNGGGITGVKASSVTSKSNSGGGHGGGGHGGGGHGGGGATPPAPGSVSSTASMSLAPAGEKTQIAEVFDDDIDLEHPDVIEDETDAEEQTFGSRRPSNGPPILEPQQADTVPVAARSSTEDPAQHATESEPLNEVSANHQTTMLSVKAKGKQAVRSPPNGHLSSRSENKESTASYVRTAHGLALESLAVYLLPVKASVLIRHVDLHSLKSLCLLNVGPQRLIWASLNKLRRQSPLQICSVYTDDVTRSLLTFLGNLPERQLEELALLEHGPRAKVPQLEGAGKTQVDAADILNMVLKKHMKGLKRLVMRNDADERWTIDLATVRLIAREGQNLAELGVQCYSNEFHTLTRSLPLLTHLYALQVVFILEVPPASTAMNSNHTQPMGANFPSSLTSLIANTILEELRHNIIDIMSQCGTADFALEYVGLAAVNGNAPSNVGLGPPAVVLSRLRRIWEVWSDDDGESEDREEQEREGAEIKEGEGGGSRSRSGSRNDGDAKKEAQRQLVVWTEDNLRMADVQGRVKMWSKELWAGRL